MTKKDLRALFIMCSVVFIVMWIILYLSNDDYDPYDDFKNRCSKSGGIFQSHYEPKKENILVCMDKNGTIIDADTQ